MKLTKEELENVKGEELESFLAQRRFRLSTSPFGAAPGKVIVYVGKSVPWKRRGKVPKNLHLPQP